jgi:hypothetical protein
MLWHVPSLSTVGVRTCLGKFETPVQGLRHLTSCWQDCWYLTCSMCSCCLITHVYFMYFWIILLYTISILSLGGTARSATVIYAFLCYYYYYYYCLCCGWHERMTALNLSDVTSNFLPLKRVCNCWLIQYSSLNTWVYFWYIQTKFHFVILCHPQTQVSIDFYVTTILLVYVLSILPQPTLHVFRRLYFRASLRTRYCLQLFHLTSSCLHRTVIIDFSNVHTNLYEGAVPWLRRLVAGLSPRRPEFDPGSVYVGLLVDKVALGQVFPPVPL